MTALLLLAAGLTGVLEGWARYRPRRTQPALLWGGGALATVLVALLGLGPADLSVPALLPGLLTPVLWLAWGRAWGGGRGPLARVVALAAALALSLVPLLAAGAPEPTAGEQVLAVLGTGLLMGGPSNDAVAALLTLVREGAAGAEGASGALLRGGRWIGALERMLVLVLAFSDVPAAVGAVVAAKGVIRFPEISRDAGEGTNGGAKAEEFLIGSFSSWLLAAGVYLLLRALGVG
ncbi:MULTISPECIES: hypothetical protein [Actinomyces]|uniref:Uncharacterized protein n=1 Tax=Actinomyces respiraculi TaxID=2744574 RepID=A0A7T0LIS1_9ACTO|nr:MULTISPECIES: hypothetical protein [Actinomyces]QPL04516.1 hypothetical protein ID810_06790 [Actinomyces respiraculi]